MDLTKITLAQISAFIVAVGVLSGLFGKFFSQIYKIKQLEERMKKTEERMNAYETTQKEQKNELLDKVEQTNSAVNLLCSAISALIDNELNDNGSTEELKRIKQKLDDKKELV